METFPFQNRFLEVKFTNLNVFICVIFFSIFLFSVYFLFYFMIIFLIFISALIISPKVFWSYALFTTLFKDPPTNLPNQLSNYVSY